MRRRNGNGETVGGAKTTYFPYESSSRGKPNFRSVPFRPFRNRIFIQQTFGNSNATRR